VRLQTRLFLLSLSLSVIVLAVVAFQVSRGVGRQIDAHADKDLRRLVEVARFTVVRSTHVDDALADELAEATNVRVTFIDVDGFVLGDSWLDEEGLSKAENHRGRPEVAGAFDRGFGTDQRWSATVHENFTYVARRVDMPGRKPMVVRCALPSSEIRLETQAVTRLVLVTALIAIGLAIALSASASSSLARVVRTLTVTANRMASGDLSVRSGLRGTDELSELGRALDKLATELSAAMEGLRAETDLLTGLLEGMQEGVLVTDREGRLQIMNRALREMLLIGADAVGRPVAQAVENAELGPLLEEARKKGSSVAELDLPGIKPRRVLVHASKLLGPRAGEVAVFFDVTEVRRLENLRRDFVANVSHELRTPVTAVRSAAETLRDAVEADPRSAVRFIDMIERNAARLQACIDDLLFLSRIEAKQYNFAHEAVDPSAVGAAVLTLFRPRAETRNVRLDLDTSPTHPRVWCDPRALEQILTNLVENAIKYCPDSTVTVRTRLHEGKTRVMVADTGPGIGPKQLPRIFERFFRVDPGRSRDMGGTGLGLSIVKHLVEALGGTIVVESELGRGTTFLIDLPPVPAFIPAPAQSSVRPVADA
jgi:two-component system phosphate regulon sensor histidine kinase PhoR